MCRALSYGFVAVATVATLAATSAPARAATVHEQLTDLAHDITYTSARLFPIQATQLGIPGYDGDLERPSEPLRAAFIARLQDWQKRLKQLAPPEADLSLVDRDDAKLLAAQLVGNLNFLLVRQQDRKDYAAGAN